MAQQAPAVLKKHLDLTSRHEAKLNNTLHGSQSTGRIHSLRTYHKYADALKHAGQWAKDAHGLRYLDTLTADQAREYLTTRAASGISQKQLDADRIAMGFIVGKLERVYSTVTPDTGTRAYTHDQARAIAAAQTPRNALATAIAYTAGLRAHELLTLRRADTADHASAHRSWHPDRFTGRSGERYLVTGKGGLVREVLIPEKLAARLETRALATPRTVTDRGIHYTQRYDLAGGNAWSRSTTDAAERALGWSTGAHGLRHAYAQQRLSELQGQGKNYAEAREIVSQEMGHFRGDVVEVYLR